jgi:hypothetical protein
LDEGFSQSAVKAYFDKAGKTSISAEEFVKTHGKAEAKKHHDALRAEAKSNGPSSSNAQHDRIAKALKSAIKNHVEGGDEPFNYQDWKNSTVKPRALPGHGKNGAITKMYKAFESVELTEEDWQNANIYHLDDSHVVGERMFVFPNAGCC